MDNTFFNSIFGAIELDADDSTSMIVEVVVNGRTSECHLYIGQGIADDPELTAKTFSLLEKLEQLDDLARDILVLELQASNQLIIDFIDFHLDEVHDKVAEKLGEDDIDHAAFLDGLDLRGVGVHVSDDTIQFNCDYCIGKDFTDELLVVRFDAEGTFIEVAHES